MRRRQFLASAALLGTTAVAGCLGSNQANPSTPTAVESVESWSFEREDLDTHDGHEQPPTIRCVPSSSRVRITGTMEGGRECDTIAPKSITRDTDGFQFTVGVSEGGSCPDLMVIRGYTAEFTFAGTTPDRVVAVESIPESWGESARAEKRCDG